MALGMMKHVEAEPVLRFLLEKRSEDWLVRSDIARALSLLDENGCGRFVLDLLAESDTINNTSFLVLAAGEVGDRTAVKPLLDIFQDKKRPQDVRGYAAVALGLLAEKTFMSWKDTIRIDLNQFILMTSVHEAARVL